MKLRNDHELFNGLCCGCNAAVKGEDVDPDRLYRKLLCGRCLAELEELPLRHKVVFDRLKREMEKVVGEVEFLNTQIALFKGFIIAHGLSPDDADDSYLPSKCSCSTGFDPECQYDGHHGVDS